MPPNSPKSGALRLVGYLRVSTDRQAEEGLGLEIQEQAIRKWAKANGHKIVGVHRDEGVSGSNGIDSREALPDAFADIRRGWASGIVVARLDRLARDLIVQETLLAEVRRLGGEMFSSVPGESAYLGDDPDDPSRKLIRQVLGAVAEYDRAMTVLRLKSGRRRKAEKGGFAYGAPAFGYEAHDGALVPLGAEQVTIGRVRDLCAAEASIREIARILTAEGHRTKRGGTRWHPTTVARLVARLEA